MADDPDRFLDAAVAAGRLTAAQAADCRRLAAALDELEMPLDVADIAVRKGFLTHDAVDVLRRELARRRVGRYTIVDRLGEGGTGIVWRAHDTKLDRDVALKILSRKVEGLDPFRERFLREARVAVTLNHVNIVRGLDYGEADGYRYFAMELVPGESLAQRIEWEGRLSEREAVRIARDVVTALEHVASYRLVHRDIKPENLLITPTGQVKLCDLGLAKPTLEEWQRIGDAPAAGTPMYMAPEQIRAPDSVDWRTDVYGLGATLFHALTGTPPFAGDENGSVIHKHLTAAPPDPRDRVFELTPGVAMVVLRMLQKAPDDRYASLDQLAADLDAILAGRPPVHAVASSLRETTPAPTASQRIALESRSRPWRPRVAAVVCCAGAAVLAGYLAWPADPLAQVVADRRPERVEIDPASTRRGPGPLAPPVIATPPQPEPPRDPEAARRALAIADDYRTAEPPDLEQAREQYEFVAERYPGTPAASAARRGLSLVLEHLERLGERDLEARFAQARAAEGRGDLAEAVRLLDAFPFRFEGTRAAADARAEADRFRKAGQLLAMQALDRVDSLVAAREFQAARAQLDVARRADTEPGRVHYDRRAEWIDAQQADHLRRYDAEHPAFELWAGHLLRRAVLEGASVARRDLVEAKFPAHAREIAALVGDFARLAEVMSSVSGAVSFDRSEGERGVPVQLDATDPAAVEGWALLCLAHGDFASATLARARLVELNRAPDGIDGHAARVRASLRADVDELLAAARAAESERGGADPRRLVERALALLPQSRAAQLELGRLELKARQWGAARTAFEAARPLPDALLELARLHLRGGELDLAEAELRAALLEVGPEAALHADLQTLLRDVQERRLAKRVALLEKDLRRAVGAQREELCRQILDLQSDHLDALRELGEAYLESPGRSWERTFDGAFLLDRYVTLERRGDTRSRRARELLVALAPLREPPDTITTQYARSALATAREGGDGRDDAEQALLRRPFLESAHLALSLSLLHPVRRAGGDPTGLGPALRGFDRLLRAYPENWEGRAGRAEARLLAGDFDGALADARLAFDGDRTLDRPALITGRAHLKRGDVADALAAFQSAFTRRPSAEALVWQAEAHSRLGQYAAARGLIDHDLQGLLVPDELRDHLERLRETLGTDPR